MGAVYLAQHATLDTQVAIKILLPSFENAAQAERSARRFVEEAKSLAKVRHPSLVQIHDAGVLPDGTLFIQMEYMEGETLRERIERERRLPLKLVLSIGRQLAAVLKVVHAEGLVHRDLKPGNVFLVSDPEAEGGVRAKLLDFGLAQMQRNARRERHGERSSSHSGVPQGTARYMSPEQCKGSPNLDGQSDIHALDLLLYEALAGESPYGLVDEEPLPWMYAHVEKRPRCLRELCANALESLDELIARMLDKLPAQRPSVEEVESRLRRLLSESALPPSSTGKTRVALLGLLGVALGSGVWVVATRKVSVAPSQQHPRTESSHPLPTQTPQLAVTASQAPEGMVPIPGQTFVMGSTQDEVEAALALCQRHSKGCTQDEFLREAKRRRVTVQSFYLDRTEVTNEAYVAWQNKPLRPLRIEFDRIVYTENTKLLDLHEAASGITIQNGRYSARAGAAKLPVVQVTWHGASLFCKSEGKRWPTEAEWELAARGASPITARTPWPWGTESPVCERVTVARDTDGLCHHLGPVPVAIGTSAGDVTPHGVFDLGGNVREWVLDRFAVPYPDCGECVDPVVAATQADGPQTRVVRGGNWLQGQTSARSAWRSRFQEDQVTTALGFRCASPVKG